MNSKIIFVSILCLLFSTILCLDKQLKHDLSTDSIPASIDSKELAQKVLKYCKEKQCPLETNICVTNMTECEVFKNELNTCTKNVSDIKGFDISKCFSFKNPLSNITQLPQAVNQTALCIEDCVKDPKTVIKVMANGMIQMVLVLVLVLIVSLVN